MRQSIKAMLYEELACQHDIKYSMMLEKMALSTAALSITTMAYFCSNALPVLNREDIHVGIEEAIAMILRYLDEFTNGQGGRGRMETKARSNDRH